ncbi:unnamed protein product [Timema podura]|uniref:Uncharacterized protein n=1 Tax=Timema podura TaxID=61482 RepID=A0ABN7PL57_TIMPD|nr:unnamed protein product [Timema podura]
MGKSRTVFKVLTGKHNGKRSLGRFRCRWEDNIRMDLKEISAARNLRVPSDIDYPRPDTPVRCQPTRHLPTTRHFCSIPANPTPTHDQTFWFDNSQTFRFDTSQPDTYPRPDIPVRY